jgi:glyoxylase-like metal-dependent hydrolase (beta-lactamase superfamily II)
MQAQIAAFFDPATFTYSYVVSDPATRACAIIDPVLDYDAASGRTSRHSAQRIIDHVREQHLHVEWLLETHVHADHLSAAHFLKEQLGGRMGIGSMITQVQKTFGELFNAEVEFATDGRQFDQLFADNQTFTIGTLQATAWHTPGHTPACMSYLVGDAVFVGDTLFMPDYGTARCDFPGGDASVLYRSIQRLLSLPDATRLFMCHDYKAPGRSEYLYLSNVAEQRAGNVHIHQGISQEQFVEMRKARDATLGMPVLILPSVQINMRAGELPPAEANGTRYLKIPLDVL